MATTPAPSPDRSELAAPPATVDLTDASAVRVRGLRSRYDDFEAVRGIDLHVRHGELFALLGSNGAGKTTTLETLEGLRAPSDGHVEVLGRDPRRARRELAGLTGTVAQHSGLPKDLTARESLQLWRALTPDVAAHLDADEALRTVELTHRAEVRVGQLSGGERRRLDLAIALSHRPRLLFLDEPTTGMDPEARTRTWEIVRDLLDDGVTVVLTTHYLDEAEALADRLAILHEGRIVVEGTVADVAATLPATIEVRPDAGAAAPRPPALHGELTVADDGRLTVTTRQLQPDLFRLLAWADEHGVTFTDLRASDASLEQVFRHVVAPDREDPR